MQKQPYVPLPQPKQVQSAKTKAAVQNKDALKKRMGMKGEIKEGDLINKAKSLKTRTAIMGLV